MDESTVISVTCCETTHSVKLDGLVTCDDFFRHCISLAKAQGYILSNIEEALEVSLGETQDELRVIKRVRN